MRELSRRRLVLIAATVVLLGWVASLAYLALRPGEQRSSGSPEAPAAVGGPDEDRFRGNRLPEGIAGTPAPSFRLADARGGAVSTVALRGRPYVVTFLYTDCRDTCPLIAAELRKALELLGGESRRAAVLAVSADPRSDTRPAVRRWLRRRRMPANFHYRP